MRRAERKLQLSHNVIGDDTVEQNGKGTSGVETIDLKSIIFGLHMFDPSEISTEKSEELNMPELNAMTAKVIAMRDDQRLEGTDSKYEVNQIDVISGGNSAFVDYDHGLDEEMYQSWVRKFKEASQSSGNQVLDLGHRRNLPEDKHLKLEAARKKAEEKKLFKWESLGYHSLSVKDPDPAVDGDVLSDSGSLHFVFGDCTDPAKVCPSEPTIIFRYFLVLPLV